MTPDVHRPWVQVTSEAEGGLGVGEGGPGWVTLVIDEMQDLDPGLPIALLMVQQVAGQRGWPFYIIGAGPSSLPGRLADSRSYTERLFHYRKVGQVDPAAAAEALTMSIKPPRCGAPRPGSPDGA